MQLRGPKCALSALVTCLVIASAAADSLAQGGASVLIKPRPDATEAYVEFTGEAVQKMSGPDGAPSKIETRSVYGLMLKSSAKGDGLQLDATLDRLFGFMSFGESIKSRFDSDDPEAEDASPDHKAAFTPILSMPLKITLDGQGVGAAVEGAEPIRQKLKALGEQNFVASSLAREDFADRSVMSAFGESLLVLLPNREVKTGETWKKTQHDDYPQVGKVILNYECKLEQVEKAADGDVAVIRFEGTVAKDADEKPAKDQRLGNMNGRFSGTAKFSVAKGCLIEMSRETTATVEVQPWWTKDQSAPLMKIEGEYKAGLAVRPAAERTQQKAEIARRLQDARAAREAEEAEALSGAVDPVTPENPPVAWLQWGGPDRNFSSTATGLANRWSKEGPAKLWERPLGDGFSAILCDGDALYTMYSLREKEDAFKGDEVVIALDAKSGKTIWEYKYAAPWPKDLQMEFGPGPHSTPVVVGDRVFAVGCTAQLTCLDKKSGKLIWSKDLLGEFKAALNGRGYGSSPLAHGGNIVLPVSSEKGHAVMAFAQSDGAVAWKLGDFEPGYASLLTIQVGGSEHLIAFTGKDVRGIDPAGGDKLWSIEHPTQWGANISTPIWNAADGLLFVSSAYGMGSRGVKIEKTGDGFAAKEAWFNPRMKIQHADAVRAGEWIYGSSGDFGPAFLACVNAKTGDFGWRQRGISKANVIHADGKLVVLDEDGTLYLVKADPGKYRLLAKAPGICHKTAWTAPTLCGRTLYVRDREKILALNLGAAAAP
ncbi:outer membrane biogenesis protein BamB [Phycisphaerae bacterium RAS1]|nr:outer membrane biogenesis protein BamB [Phycisphaerae bacterium RAS1]